MPEGSKSGFHYLGIGCLILGVLFVLVAAVVGFSGFRWVRDVEKTMRDPEMRESKVLDLLGADELPEGYYAMIGVSIPLLLETAILTDQEPEADGDPPDLGSRGLIYLSMRNFGRDREDLDAFFSGETEDPTVLAKHDIDIDLDERVATGRIERDSGPVLWVSHRGTLISAQTHGQHEGLVTLLQIRCPGDERNRLGIWFGPEPETGDETTDLAGSIADPARVDAFVDHFRFCPN